MSKTAQRREQAYQEGFKHGAAGYGCVYSQRAFMVSYMRGLADGTAANQPPTLLELFRRKFA